MENKDNIFISVIIPVYNGEKTIGHCLKSVFASDYPYFEVITVDDGSKDDSLNILKQYPPKMIQLNENRGPSVARNKGAEVSRGDVLFFLDADIIIERDTLREIAQSFKDKPEIAALFCSYQAETLPENFLSAYKNLIHHYTHQNSYEEAATFCGGFGAVKRDVFLKMSGFDKNHRWLEDIEFGYRLHQAGYQIYLNKKIQVTHCKEYNLFSLIKSEVFGRAIPWTRLMLRSKIFRNDLNTKVNNIFSVPVSFLILLSFPFILTRAGGIIFGSLLALLIVLNQHFYRFVLKTKGMIFTFRTMVMHWFNYLYSGMGLVLGMISYFRKPLTGSQEPGAAPGEPFSELFVCDAKTGLSGDAKDHIVPRDNPTHPEDAIL